MGVYINDMKMPKSCTLCKLMQNSGNSLYCPLQSKKDNLKANFLFELYANCPLIEVLEQHGRLGDLDRLEKMFADIDNAPYSGFDGTEPFYSAEDAAQIIRLAPTIIEAEE